MLSDHGHGVNVPSVMPVLLAFADTVPITHKTKMPNLRLQQTKPFILSYQCLQICTKL